ncbi:MAG TPA: aminotransferase class V-fold PLP-dependent enzyme, partial [candidate division Zixibacteria bacterium]
MITLEKSKNQRQDKIKLFREKVVGIDKKVPTLEGLKTYVNFDNAASTPTLKPVLDKVNEFLEWYSSIHRGSGFKSLLSSEIYEKARLRIGEFFKDDLKKNTVIFGKNTTEALNK